MEEGIWSSVFRGGERFLGGRAEIGNSSIFFSYLKKKARWVPQALMCIIYPSGILLLHIPLQPCSGLGEVTVTLEPAGLCDFARRSRQKRGPVCSAGAELSPRCRGFACGRYFARWRKIVVTWSGGVLVSDFFKRIMVSLKNRTPPPPPNWQLLKVVDPLLPGI